MLDLAVLVAKWVVNYRSRREFYARELFLRAAARFTPLVAAPMGPSMCIVPTADAYVGRQVFLWGGFEDTRNLPLVLDVLNREGLSSTSSNVFVDVGANIGTATLSAVGQHGFSRAIAFEPDIMNCRLIRLNLLWNGLDDRVDVHCMALSDRTGELVLLRDPTNMGGHQVAQGSSTGVGGHPSTIRAETMDHMLEVSAISPADIGLVWIDVEGYEGHVLDGAKRLTAAGVPILLEYWPTGLERAGGLVTLEQVVSLNYTHVLDVKRASTTGEFEFEPAESIEKLRSRYRAEDHTDLLLLRRVN